MRGSGLLEDPPNGGSRKGLLEDRAAGGCWRMELLEDGAAGGWSIVDTKEKDQRSTGGW